MSTRTQPPGGAAAPGARKQADPAARLAFLASMPDEALILLSDVSLLGNWSDRHTHRLKDAGALPPACRVGRLLRFRLGAIRQWFRDGCPAQQRRASR
jgi:hypothetical protein